MVADALHLPLVVNTPACLEIYEMYSHSRFGVNDRTCACCGIICILEPFILSIRQMSISGPCGSQTSLMARHVNRLPERLVLMNSFWGLEPPALLPPNIRLTGPLNTCDQVDALKVLNSKHKELLSFLQDAMTDGKPVFYITLGTKLQYSDWCLKTMLEGLRKANKRKPMKVVWHIRQDLSPDFAGKEAGFIKVVQ